MMGLSRVSRSHSSVVRVAKAVLLGGGAAMLLSGCAIVPGLNVDASDAGAETVGYRLVVVDGQSIKLLNSEGNSSLPTADQADVAPTTQSAPEDYRIGPGDIVHVTVWDHPELTVPTGQVQTDITASGRVVSAQGMIFYPYVGDFKVVGMTVGDLRKLLTSKLARIISSPQIDARVIAFRSQRVQVAGEVKAPGPVALDDTYKGIIEAINERGGFSPTASRRKAYLTREGKTLEINLSALLNGAGAAQIGPKLQPDDVIMIPDQSEDQVFVLGEVERQQPVPLRQGKTTVIEVLAFSGGLDKLRASDSGVLIFRRPASGELVPTVFRLDMNNPLGLLLAGEFELQPRDVVYVKATDFAKYNSVIGQFLPTITAIFQLDRLVSRN